VRKALIVLGIIAALSAVGMGSLAFYIYRLNLGVDYKGRARLDYNWKYHFAACPKEEHKYEGRFFSFSYPKFQEKNPLCEISWNNGTAVVSDDHLFDISSYKSTPKKIKSELLGYLALADGKAFPRPSQYFLHWLLGSVEDPNFNKVYSVHLDKVHFKNNGVAILVSLSSKVEKMPHYKVVTGILPDGNVFELKNTVRLNASEETYRFWVLSPSKSWLYGPRPAQDAQSACVLNRFLRTFEFKQ